MVILLILFAIGCKNGSEENRSLTHKTTASIVALNRKIPANYLETPSISNIPAGKDGDMIRYGYDLLAHTARYFGPKGTIAHLTNGMNCQNCHLAGGTRIFGNNYRSVSTTYPSFSPRSNKAESLTERFRQCFERSLNGKTPDTTGKEIKAMLAYMKWIGQGVKKGQKLYGRSTEKLAYMTRPADPDRGRALFVNKCQLCHGKDGQGVLAPGKTEYTYPPLWGKHSYNDGAGMYMISKLAGYIKNNMPYGATYQNPQLTDEQAWDVAAFINSQPRPHRDQHADWKDTRMKPIDFPFGPYADAFSETQHKYGPYLPMKHKQL
ncbi:MAG: c-type cytochrome [Mucilaginibacter sp.]